MQLAPVAEAVVAAADLARMRRRGQLLVKEAALPRPGPANGGKT